MSHVDSHVSSVIHVSLVRDYNLCVCGGGGGLVQTDTWSERRAVPSSSSHVLTRNLDSEAQQACPPPTPGISIFSSLLNGNLTIL